MKSIVAYAEEFEKGTKLKTNWQAILLMIKAIYAFEFWRALTEDEVILGSKTARATIPEINMKILQNIKVIVTWKRCHPFQHIISGYYVITSSWLFSSKLHSTTEKSIYVIGIKKTVTKRGTIWPSITSGHVNLNFFLLKL